MTDHPTPQPGEAATVTIGRASVSVEHDEHGSVYMRITNSDSETGCFLSPSDAACIAGVLTTMSDCALLAMTPAPLYLESHP